MARLPSTPTPDWAPEGAEAAAERKVTWSISLDQVISAAEVRKQSSEKLHFRMVRFKK